MSVITEHGQALLDGLDEDVRSAAIASLRGLNSAQLQQLERLLDAVRPDAGS